jgi:hypothetical protein
LAYDAADIQVDSHECSAASILDHIRQQFEEKAKHYDEDHQRQD